MLGRLVGAGVDVQRQRQVRGAEDTAHQVVDPIGAVDEAEQRLHALVRRACRQVRTIHGHIEQHPGLDRAMGLLYQRHLAGDAGLAELRRALHGLLAYRFGVHVVAEGRQVAPAERFQKDDRGVQLALASWVDVVIGKALGADARHMGGSLSWTDGLGEADALDARITLGQGQSFDVQPPLFAADLLHRVEQAGAAEQDLFMVAQALADRLGDLLAQHLELLLGGPVLIGAQALPDDQLHQQREHQHAPGDTVSPGEELAQAARGTVVNRWVAHHVRCGTRVYPICRPSADGRVAGRSGRAAQRLAVSTWAFGMRSLTVLSAYPR